MNAQTTSTKGSAAGQNSDTQKPSPADFDSRSQEIACGTESLDEIPEHYLIHAARYEGPGWSQARRSEIVRRVRALILPSR